MTVNTLNPLDECRTCGDPYSPLYGCDCKTERESTIVVGEWD